LLRNADDDDDKAKEYDDDPQADKANDSKGFETVNYGE
jgi:hypothetical protein